MLGFSSDGLPQFSGIKKSILAQKNQFKFPRCVGSCYCKVVLLACSVPCLSACRNYTGSCLVAPFLEIPFFQNYVFFSVIFLYVCYIGKVLPPECAFKLLHKNRNNTKTRVCSKLSQTIESCSAVPIHFNHIVACAFLCR